MSEHNFRSCPLDHVQRILGTLFSLALAAVERGESPTPYLKQQERILASFLDVRSTRRSVGDNDAQSEEPPW